MNVEHGIKNKILKPVTDLSVKGKERLLCKARVKQNPRRLILMNMLAIDYLKDLQDRNVIHLEGC